MESQKLDKLLNKLINTSNRNKITTTNEKQKPKSRNLESKDRQQRVKPTESEVGKLSFRTLHSRTSKTKDSVISSDRVYKLLPEISDQAITVKAGDIVKKLKLAKTVVDDELTKLKNIPGTIFPLNTPCYINGSKGSGKTYLLSSILQYAESLKLYKRYIYIYAENVDTTVIRALNNDHLIQIPKLHAEAFLFKFLYKKNKYMSCMRYINDPVNYWDNLLDKLIKQKQAKLGIKTTSLDKSGREDINLLIGKYCVKTCEKYQKITKIKIGDVIYDIGVFSPTDYDCIIIDDIGQFSSIIGSTRKNSEIYKYFTITRQNLTTFYMTGQEIQQLPLMIRSQLGCLVLMKGSNMADLKMFNLNKNIKDEIIGKYKYLSTYEGVIWNFNTEVMEELKAT